MTDTTTDSTETGGYATAISGKGTRLAEERDPVAGIYSNEKAGAAEVLIRFVPVGQISTVLNDDAANRISTWCEDRDGIGVFGIQYTESGETHEDRGVYFFESVVNEGAGEWTSVRLHYFESTNPALNLTASNFWTGHYKEKVCHVAGGVLIVDGVRFVRISHGLRPNPVGRP